MNRITECLYRIVWITWYWRMAKISFMGCSAVMATIICLSQFRGVTLMGPDCGNFGASGLVWTPLPERYLLNLEPESTLPHMLPLSCSTLSSARAIYWQLEMLSNISPPAQMLKQWTHNLETCWNRQSQFGSDVRVISLVHANQDFMHACMSCGWSKCMSFHTVSSEIYTSITYNLRLC